MEKLRQYINPAQKTSAFRNIEIRYEKLMNRRVQYGPIVVSIEKTSNIKLLRHGLAGICGRNITYSMPLVLSVH